MKETWRDEMLVSRAFSRLIRLDGYVAGEVATTYGFVAVYAEENLARFDFICGGRLYTETTRGASYSLRGLTTKAHRFAKGIVDSEAGV